jgi:hypothetical protein
VNNFVTPDQLARETPAAAILNTVTPTSTTAAMTGEQPLENKPTESTTLADKVAEERIAEDKIISVLTF